MENNNQLSRRDFLKHLGLGATGVAAITTASSLGAATAVDSVVELSEDHEKKEGFFSLGVSNGIFATVGLGEAILNIFKYGHPTSKDWATAMGYLGVHLVDAKNNDHLPETLHHLKADLGLLLPVLVGTILGDNFDKVRKKLGTPDRIILPPLSEDLSADLVTDLTAKTLKNIVNSLPTIAISTGAAAIDSNRDIVALSNRLFFAPAINEFENAIKNLENSNGVISTEILELKKVCAESVDYRSVNQALDDLGMTISSRGNLELGGHFETLSKRLKYEAGMENESWEAIHNLVSTARMYINFRGKLLLGDPPNYAVFINQVMAGKLSLSEAIEMQLKGFVKNTPVIEKEFTKTYKKFNSAFGGRSLSAGDFINASVTSRELMMLPKAMISARFSDIKTAMTSLDANSNEFVNTIKNIGGDVFSGLKEEVDAHIEWSPEKAEKKIFKTFGIRESSPLLNKSLLDLKNFLLEDPAINSEKISVDIHKKDWRKFVSSVSSSNPKSISFLLKNKNISDESAQKLLEEVRSSMEIRSNETLSDKLKKDAFNFSTLEDVFNNIKIDRQSLMQQELLDLLESFDGVDFESDSLQSALAKLNESEKLAVKNVYRKSNASYSKNPLHGIERFTNEIIPIVQEHAGHGTSEVLQLVLLQFLFLPSIMPLLEASMKKLINRHVPDFSFSHKSDSHEEPNGHLGVQDEIISNNPLSESAYKEIVSANIALCTLSSVADNLVMYMACEKIFSKLMSSGYFSKEQYLDACQRTFDAAIESGEVTYAGGPASAPFSDEKMEAPRQSAHRLVGNIFGSLPILDVNIPFFGNSVSAGVKSVLGNIAAEGVVNMKNFMTRKEKATNSESKSTDNPNSIKNKIKKVIGVILNPMGALVEYPTQEFVNYGKEARTQELDTCLSVLEAGLTDYLQTEKNEK